MTEPTISSFSARASNTTPDPFIPLKFLPPAKSCQISCYFDERALQASPISVSALQSPVVKYQLEVLEKQNAVYYYFFKTGTNGFNLSLAAPKQRGLRGRITAVGLPLLPADQLHRRQRH